MSTTQFPVEKTAKNGRVLVYDIAKPGNLEEMVDFFVKHFVAAPPIRQIYFLTGSEEIPTPFWALWSIGKCLAEPVSLLVREKTTGHLVAFVANHILKKETFQPSPTFPPDDKRIGWLASAILAELDRGVDLFALFGTDRILEASIATVRPDYGGLGINVELGHLSEDICRIHGIGALRTAAFSRFAGRNPTNRLIKSVDYDTFEIHGTRPLANVDMGVHKSARLLARAVGKVPSREAYQPKSKI